MHHQSLAEMSPSRRYFEYVVRFLVFYSIGSYLLELEFDQGRFSTGFWLTNERFVAGFFTLEYVTRWVISDNRKRFPFKFLSIIDLVAILPFFVGFFVDDHILDIIRTLRVLRMLKLIRYSPALLNVMQGIGRVKKELLVVGYVVLIVIILSSVMILQFEKAAQPDKFANPSDALYWAFTTMATVGYGDLSPITIGGRLVAIFTMVIGIGIFGVFVSLIGSAFVVTLKEEIDEQREADRSLQHQPPETLPGQRPSLPEATKVGT